MPDKIGPTDLLAQISALPRGTRQLVAIAGAPGSGKSTVAEWLSERLNDATPGRSAVLPMDGYHFDDGVLKARGRLARKGAPDTFDVGGLASMLTRLKRNDADEVAIPVFDREIEIARAGAALIPKSVEIVLAEGNYLLSGEAPWSALNPMFDLRVLVYVSEAELRRRLRARWVYFGLDEAGIRRKLEENDLPNGDYVYRHSIGMDAILDGEADLDG